MNYPKKLTIDEWNLLQDLTTYNKMDCWFDLKHTPSKDYVYDSDNDENISLRKAIKQVAEGLIEEDLGLFNNGYMIWNKLMDKFNLKTHKI